jgi:hypothetical protein
VISASIARAPWRWLKRALRESSEDSNGERENDALTKTLQTKEQQGHICGVSSKLTWKEGFFGIQIYIPEAENDLDTTC